MKQMTLKELGWDHIDFGFDVKYVAGDRVECLGEICIEWWAFSHLPLYDTEFDWWFDDYHADIVENKLICTEPHPMALYPEHTLIEIVEE